LLDCYAYRMQQIRQDQVRLPFLGQGILLLWPI
jgi:hypothetical protein